MHTTYQIKALFKLYRNPKFREISSRIFICNNGMKFQVCKRINRIINLFFVQISWNIYK